MPCKWLGNRKTIIFEIGCIIHKHTKTWIRWPANNMDLCMHKEKYSYSANEMPATVILHYNATHQTVATHADSFQINDWCYIGILISLHPTAISHQMFWRFFLPVPFVHFSNRSLSFNICIRNIKFILFAFVVMWPTQTDSALIGAKQFRIIQ